MTVAVQLDPDDREGLLALVREEQGNRSRIADRIGLSRQGVSARLRKLGLLREADDLKLSSGTPGPRPSVGGRVKREERNRILDALAAAPNREAALPELGMTIAALYRRMKWLKITDSSIERRKRKLQAAPAGRRRQRS